MEVTKGLVKKPCFVTLGSLPDIQGISQCKRARLLGLERDCEGGSLWRVCEWASVSPLPRGHWASPRGAWSVWSGLGDTKDWALTLT